MIGAGITHDVVLDAQGFMLANGKDTYEVEAAGPSNMALASGNETVTGSATNSIGSWQRLEWNNWRGVGRWFWDGERENRDLLPSTAKLDNSSAGGLVNDLVGVRPLLGGAVLGLAPSEYVATSGANPSSNHREVCFYIGFSYVAIDKNLYRVTLDANSNFAGLNAVAGWAGSGPIEAMVVHNGLLYICQSGRIWWLSMVQTS